VALFVTGACSMYLGASLAVHLFDEVAVASVAWLRVVGAALVLAIVVRPWRRRWSRSFLVAAAAFGTATAVMNLCFYLAIDRLPLGTAVAIEFVGPVSVAAAATRTVRNAAALVLAVGGVALLSGIEADANLGGVLFALAAAACWAAYIVLGARVSRFESGIDGLTVGLVIGAVVIAPIGAWDAGPALTSPRLFFLCVAVGVLSNAVPYGLDQLVLRRVDRGTFALLLALLPTTATIIGALVLRQVPDALEVVGIGLVVASLCVTRTPVATAPDAAVDDAARLAS
jgi:inner membrane transporter RhtA